MMVFGAHVRYLLFAVLILAPGQSAADWLPMRDGSRLETRGPWEVKDTLVVLTLPGGTLASLPVGDVDLGASGGAAGGAGAPPARHLTPVRESAFVLTDRDLPSAPAPSSEIAFRQPDAGLGGSEVRVVFWAEFKAHEILGTLHNPGATTARVSSVAVEIVDSHGRIRSQKALPREPLLDAGESTSFRVRFPDVGAEHGDPSFTVFADSFFHDPSRRLRGPED